MTESNTTPQQGQESPPPEEAPAEKLYTQAEFETESNARLAEFKKKMPSEETMKRFRAWEKSQQTEKERWDSLTRERDEATAALTAAQTEVEQYRRERALIAMGVPVEDVDYYAFKIGQNVTEALPFEKAAQQFLKDHPPKPQTEGGMVVNMTAPLTGGTPKMSLNERVNQMLRG